ncbi:MAG: DoxX family protein [Pseudonocardiaceae bacterium]
MTKVGKSPSPAVVGASAVTRLSNVVFTTSDDYAALVMRVFLGVVIFPHGAQKLLGWFGGLGFGGTMDYFAGLGVPAAVAFLVIVTEFFGSLALIVGLVSRVAAFGIGCIMIGASLIVHLPYGFFMDWFGQLSGEGFEYHILVVGLAAAVVIKGSGARSLDHRISRR